MEKGGPKRHGAMRSGGRAVRLWSVVSGLQVAAPPGSASLFLGPNSAVLGGGPWRAPLAAVACRACLAACPPTPLLSLFWSPSLISVLTSHSAGPSAPVSHSWEPQTQETANSGPQAWQRLGLLETELEDLCVIVFEEIKGHNFRNEYTVKNDQECTGGFYNMELLEEKIQPLK